MLALRACIQTSLRGHEYALFISLSSARWQLEKKTGDVEVQGDESLWNRFSLDVSISLDKIKISGYNTLVQCIDKTMQRL